MDDTSGGEQDHIGEGEHVRRHRKRKRGHEPDNATPGEVGAGNEPRQRDPKDHRADGRTERENGRLPEKPWHVEASKQPEECGGRDLDDGHREGD
ncbi:MAG: hypothetical protein EBT22_12935 [Chloroflexi bacterium]|nr:hypothetical protein [Chloroflexota bacterium]